MEYAINVPMWKWLGLLPVIAARRPRTRKRTFAYLFQSLATLRFELFRQPVRLVRPGGRPELRFAVSPRARERIRHCERALHRLAA